MSLAGSSTGSWSEELTMSYYKSLWIPLLLDVGLWGNVYTSAIANIEVSKSHEITRNKCLELHGPSHRLRYPNSMLVLIVM